VDKVFDTKVKIVLYQHDNVTEKVV